MCDSRQLKLVAMEDALVRVHAASSRMGEYQSRRL